MGTRAPRRAGPRSRPGIEARGSGVVPDPDRAPWSTAARAVDLHQGVMAPVGRGPAANPGRRRVTQRRFSGRRLCRLVSPTRSACTQTGLAAAAPGAAARRAASTILVLSVGRMFRRLAREQSSAARQRRSSGGEPTPLRLLLLVDPFLSLRCFRGSGDGCGLVWGFAPGGPPGPNQHQTTNLLPCMIRG